MARPKTGQPPKKNLMLTVSDETREQLSQFSTQRGESISSLVAQWVANELQGHPLPSTTACANAPLDRTNFIAEFQKKHGQTILKAMALTIAPDYDAAFTEYENLCRSSTTDDIFDSVDFGFESIPLKKYTISDAQNDAFRNFALRLQKQINEAAFGLIQKEDARFIARLMMCGALDGIQIGTAAFRSWHSFLGRWNEYHDNQIDFVGEFAIE